ncbi:unannotated protein [freshwater metagenome]|uniref:Unannotated protein n=1 Tax=freshwater metagenome TaxID=449393 RepID=A0A6J6XE44_9ZZZZ
MRKVDLMEGALIAGYVYFEASVLNGVHRKMLHVCHHTCLEPACKRCSHLPYMMRVLAIGLLSASPCGMAKQIYADRSAEVRSCCAHLSSDRRADSLLEIEIKRCSSRHAHRICSGASDYSSARTIAEIETWDTEALKHHRWERSLVVTKVPDVCNACPERRATI